MSELDDAPDGAPRPAAAGGASEPWSDEDTPLPPALPHHVADPSGPVERLSEDELSGDELGDDDDADTRPGAAPGGWPQLTGLANAARRISASLIGAGDRPAAEPAVPVVPREVAARTASSSAPGDDDAGNSSPQAGNDDDELTLPR